MRIRWADYDTVYFSVTHGVKQGGILSPALFSIYIDVLLERLRNSGQVCFVGTIFAGAFGCADDIIILCPSKFSLRTQLNVARSYSVEYLISTFHAIKCHRLYIK
jgi:retron-type reverse transcriptase